MFGPWTKKYYGDISNITFDGDEWTQGIVTPFIVTQLAPDLGCRARLLQEPRLDVILCDFSGKHQLAHIEHQNQLRDVTGEITKLQQSKPLLKFIVTYGDSPTSVTDNSKQIGDFVDDILSPIVGKIIERNPAQNWLFIAGVNWQRPDPERGGGASNFVHNGQKFEPITFSQLS